MPVHIPKRPLVVIHGVQQADELTADIEATVRLGAESIRLTFSTKDSPEILRSWIGLTNGIFEKARFRLREMQEAADEEQLPTVP